MKEIIRLLIIDDDEDDRQLFIESALEVDQNIICTSAGDGEKALQILGNSNPLPDYIFLDLRMPRLSGRKTFEEIKKDTRLSHIPIIIYTTSRELDDSDELKKMGAAHFVSKPVNPEEIYYLISSVIEERWN